MTQFQKNLVLVTQITRFNNLPSTQLDLTISRGLDLNSLPPDVANNIKVLREQYFFGNVTIALFLHFLWWHFTYMIPVDQMAFIFKLKPISSFGLIIHA